jgi:multidrug efflux pump subunit AcrB
LFVIERSKNKINKKYEKRKKSLSTIKEIPEDNSKLEESLLDKSETEHLINKELENQEKEMEFEIDSNKSQASQIDPELKKKKIKFIKLKMDYKLLKLVFYFLY